MDIRYDVVKHGTRSYRIPVKMDAPQVTLSNNEVSRPTIRLDDDEPVVRQRSRIKVTDSTNNMLTGTISVPPGYFGSLLGPKGTCSVMKC